MYNLSDTVERKFIESFDIDEWDIDTDAGWQPITAIHKTIEYTDWKIITASGKFLECADTHIIFDENYNEIFVKDCIPYQTKIITRDGPELVISVIESDKSSNMYDITVDSLDHRFWSRDILSHNSTTTCAFILWYIIFNAEKTAALLANKGDTAREILSRIELAYQHLPKWLQHGVVKWNKGSLELENNSRVIATSTSGDAIRGYAINLLFIDEAAFIDNWDEFFTSVFPTISSGTESKIILVSTPNGLNHFYKTWAHAISGKNGYQYIQVDWTKVPGRDEKWKEQILSGMNFDIEKFNQEHCCVFETTYITVKNIHTNEILHLSINEIYEML